MKVETDARAPVQRRLVKGAGGQSLCLNFSGAHIMGVECAAFIIERQFSVLHTSFFKCTG